MTKLFTMPGQIVLDPFIGSGTTLKAADQLKRRCLGCDVSRRYLETAQQRIGEQKVQVVCHAAEINQKGGFSDETLSHPPAVF